MFEFDSCLTQVWLRFDSCLTCVWLVLDWLKFDLTCVGLVLDLCWTHVGLMLDSCSTRVVWLVFDLCSTCVRFMFDSCSTRVHVFSMFCKSNSDCNHLSSVTFGYILKNLGGLDQISNSKVQKSKIKNQIKGSNLEFGNFNLEFRIFFKKWESSKCQIICQLGFRFGIFPLRF